MRNIVDLGKQGAEKMPDLHVPQAEVLPDDIGSYVAFIKTLPRRNIQADTEDGIKKTVEMRPLVLGNTFMFELAHRLAPYEPMVYAQQGNKAAFGMISPNYDNEGADRLPSIKIIPLGKPYPLTSSLKPDARMATMLAGAASAEAQGVGGHTGKVSDDFEHKATILGAVSLDDPTIALEHRNHEVRRKSSLATGLTNGQLGNLYIHNDSFSEFHGFGEPMIFEKHTVSNSDVIYFPDSFLDSEEAFGSHYIDASRIVLGAGLQALHERHGRAVTGEIGRLSTMVSTGTLY